MTGTLLAFLHSETPAKVSQRTLTFAERVSYQRAIEEVYWRHRIWPKERPDRKPSLDAVMSQAQLEKKVADYLRKSQALEDYWQRPITAEQLQAGMDRMTQHTRQPEVLRELFEALGSDPFIIAECLARPLLAERLVASSYSYEQRIHDELGQREDADLRALPAAAGRNHSEMMPQVMAPANSSYTLPKIPDGTACTDDTWTATSTTNAPDARDSHTAVWTGSEMIVWGGSNTGGVLDSGGRYNPATDSWTATSINNAPEGRSSHTAVWAGSEMIVWGGSATIFSLFNTGGKYNPNTDSWTATSITNAPAARFAHTAVWTGGEMIIWGGNDGNTGVNTGGRYNPGADSWTATSTTNAPDGRDGHKAVWTGSEMIVWGGIDFNGFFSNTGGRYNPSTDSWTATGNTNVPDARTAHTAVWTGSEMIVWAGFNGFIGGFLNTGGRYNPGVDSWTSTSMTNVPDSRSLHTAVWTGSQMIVWGGDGQPGALNTGGRYCAQGGPTPTPTPTATPTERATPTPRPRPTPPPRP